MLALSQTLSNTLSPTLSNVEGSIVEGIKPCIELAEFSKVGVFPVPLVQLREKGRLLWEK